MPVTKDVTRQCALLAVKAEKIKLNWSGSPVCTACSDSGENKTDLERVPREGPKVGGGQGAQPGWEYTCEAGWHPHDFQHVINDVLNAFPLLRIAMLAAPSSPREGTLGFLVHSFATLSRQSPTSIYLS